jgi:hypothetical protein
MSDARQAIQAAEDADAATHAPEPYMKAQQYLKDAQSKLQRRAYKGAKHDAIAAKEQAVQALKTSAAARDEQGEQLSD